jgi:hypothetical protein
VIRIPARLLPAILIAAHVLSALPAAATDFLVFPVKVSLPVRMVEVGTDPDTIVERKFTQKDIVNLALGRPLGTKVDKAREILAFASARFEEDTLEGRLIVFDPSQNGLAQVRTIVLVPTSVDREIALLEGGTQGQGTATGQVQETTLGDPTKNALHAVTGWGSGAGSKKGDKRSLKGIVAGRVSLTLTENGQTKTFSGYVVNGKASVSGKPIGMFSDGMSEEGCGDGIIQPGLGEECEFSDQTACPGKCNGCICVTCGDGNRDPGEICDPPDNQICDAQSLPSYCEPDCGGCTACGDTVVDPPEECDPLGGADTACPGQCSPATCLCPD